MERRANLWQEAWRVPGGGSRGRVEQYLGTGRTQWWPAHQGGGSGGSVAGGIRAVEEVNLRRP